MDWIKQNPFIAGLAGVTLVIAGVLIFLIMQAGGALQEAESEYATQKNNHDGLVTARIYPSRDSVEALEAQQDEVRERLRELREAFSSKQVAPEPLSPADLVSLIVDSVNATYSLAAERGVNMPAREEFFLGFNRYEESPPRLEAVDELSVLLQVIKSVAELLMEEQIDELISISRVELAVENGAPEEEEEEPQGRRGRGRRAPVVEKMPEQLERWTFIVRFKSTQEALQRVINSLQAMDQLLVTQLIAVTNESKEGPLREQTESGEVRFGEDGLPLPPEEEDAEEGEPSVRVVLGREKVESALRIQLIRLAQSEEEFEATLAGTSQKPRR